MSAEVGEPRHRDRVRVDTSGAVAESVACRRCGYNLRGLLRDTTCPECSTPVRDSIRSDLLRFSDPSWLRRVERGCWCALVGAVLGAGLPRVLLTVLGPRIPIRWEVLTGLAWLAAILLVVGGWLATTPEPARLERRLSARRLARWLLLARLLTGPIDIAATHLSARALGGSTDGTGMAVILIVVHAVAVVALCGHAAALVYLRQLVDRIPRRHLAVQFRIVLWAHVAAQTLALVGSTVLVSLMLPWLGGGAGATGWGFSPPTLLITVVSWAIGAGTIFGMWAIAMILAAAVALRRVRLMISSNQTDTDPKEEGTEGADLPEPPTA